MKSIGPKISDRHYEMLKALTKFFEGQRPAIEQAIEETHAKYIQKENQMHIKVEWSTDAIWGSTDPQEYDWQQSEANFADSLENHLYDAYPTADIQIIKGINDRIQVNGRTDDDEVPWIEQIVSKVWNGDSWLTQ